MVGLAGMLPVEAGSRLTAVLAAATQRVGRDSAARVRAARHVRTLRVV